MSGLGSMARKFSQILEVTCTMTRSVIIRAFVSQKWMLKIKLLVFKLFTVTVIVTVVLWLFLKDIFIFCYVLGHSF